jgi:hypothetical protein
MVDTKNILLIDTINVFCNSIPLQTAALSDHYVFSPAQLPAATTANRISVSLIDMSGNRDEVHRSILDAGKEFRFFMVTITPIHTPS